MGRELQVLVTGISKKYFENFLLREDGGEDRYRESSRINSNKYTRQKTLQIFPEFTSQVQIQQKKQKIS